MEETEIFTIDLPPLVERQFEFCNWIILKVNKFPKDLRYFLGTRIQEKSCLILDNLIKCSLIEKGDKGLLLSEINISIQQLRYQLRLAYQTKGINLRSYHFACKLLLDIGNQVGSWLKSVK